MKQFWIIDAFANQPFQGNPAAVMVVDDFPTHMPQIAAEFNLSETAFIKPLGNNQYHIRWCTPTTEVKLCGHATLAAAHVLFHELQQSESVIEFSSLSGDLTVKQLNDHYQLDFPLQPIEQQLPIDATFKQAFQNIQIKEVLKTLDDIIVVLNDEEALCNFIPNIPALNTLSEGDIIITAPSKKYDFVSRCFAPKEGIDEDPVTGSAHCKLADYWSKRLNKHNLFAFQASSRGGELRLSVHKDRVLISGQAVTIATGNLLVP
jgi:PhzF family phenazine biosynthesis protein